MADVDIYLSCNDTVMDLPGVRFAVKDEAEEIGRTADGIVSEVRATTPHYKIVPETSPPHMTHVTVEPALDRPIDWFGCLWALNPVALEYGHRPSGVFGPGGRYSHVKTQAPEGLYILHRAAHLI